MGSVSRDEKAWLLQHAQAVLYPTSAEGFGLVPFEAAAVGTPTAFVRFGPLAETMPDVDACAAWQVRAFADHVFQLLAVPSRQVTQIRAAAANLTWSATKATEYEVRVIIQSTSAEVITVRTAAPSYSLSALSAAETYSVSIFAVNGAGAASVFGSDPQSFQPLP